MERRAHERYQIWLPVRIEGLDDGVAVSHDASKRGLKIVSRGTLEPGAEIDIAFRLPPESESERTVRGRVVRVGPNELDPNGLWPNEMAIEFVDAIPELESLLQVTRTPARSSAPPRGD